MESMTQTGSVYALPVVARVGEAFVKGSGGMVVI